MKSNKILAILASLLILIICLSAVSVAVATGEHNTTTVGVIDDQNNDIDINNVTANDDNNDDNDNNINNITDSKLATYIHTDVNPFGSKVISSQLVDENDNPLAGKNIEIVLHNGSGSLEDEITLTTDSNGMINYDISKLKAGKYQAIIGFYGDDQYKESDDIQDFTVDGKKDNKLATHFNTDVEPFGAKVVSSQLCDENGNPLSGKTVKFTLYDKNGAVVASESKTTNDNGCVEFDTSKLKNSTYKLSIVFEGDSQYSSCSDMVTLNVSNSKNPIDMQNTGVPLIIIACAVLGLIGVGYKKYNK